MSSKKEAIKCLRTGVTESAMLLLLHNERKPLISTPFAKSKLWHLWNSIGFYDRSLDISTENRDDFMWETHVTDKVRDYWKEYLSSFEGADIVVHLRRSIEDADALFGNGREALENVFRVLRRPPSQVKDVFSYRWVKECTRGGEVLVISPFARIMERQYTSGNLSKLRPDFEPIEINFFEFPYCFGNFGPDSNSFETIERISKSLVPSVGPDVTVMLSCGSMGVPIANLLHEKGANVFYCGGAMQLFFGIMGGRWRSERVDRALDKDDDLLSSYRDNNKLWIGELPEEFIPEAAKKIENGCYW